MCAQRMRGWFFVPIGRSGLKAYAGLMPRFKAVVVLPYTTNLPRDQSQQTYCFNLDDAEESTLDQVGFALAGFYNDVQSGTGQSVSNFMANIISRANCRIEWYDVSTLPSGPPVYTYPFVLAGGTPSLSNLPLEVALVHSFQGAKITGGVQARRRGRNYLGPFSAGALNTAPNATAPIPVLVNTVVAAGAALKADIDAIDLGQWCIWSRTTDLFVPVANGWVNNEWDTQRRRELKPTARTTWGFV